MCGASAAVIGRMRIGLFVAPGLADGRRATTAELGDRQLGLAQPGLAGGVESQPAPVQLDALLEPNGVCFELLDRALQRGDELVEGLAGELLIGQYRELAVVDHPMSSSLPVRSTRVSALPRATMICSESPGLNVAASCTIRLSAVRATA